MHEHLEACKLTGEMPDQTDPEARVATAAIQYWPEGVEWRPEVEFEINRGDFVYFGFSDQFGDGDPGWVGDYKFTGNKKNLPSPDKPPFWWQDPVKAPRRTDAERAALAAQVLQHDPQWVIYGCATGSARVNGRWTYIVKPPKLQGNVQVIPVDLSDSRENLLIKLEKFDIPARDLVRMRRTLKTANEAPHNADSACGGLGIGCEFAEICERKAEMAQKTVAEIMAELQAAKAGAPEPTPTPEPTPEPVTETPAELQTVLDEANGTPEPAVNPPEGKEADTQATVEQVPEKPGKGRKKRPAKKKTAKKAEPAPEPVEMVQAETTDEQGGPFFYGLIVRATMGGTMEVGELPEGVTIPVGSRVKVVIL